MSTVYKPLTGCPSGCPTDHHECDMGTPILKPDACLTGCLTKGIDWLRYCARRGECVACGRPLLGEDK